MMSHDQNQAAMPSYCFMALKYSFGKGNADIGNMMKSCTRRNMDITSQSIFFAQVGCIGTYCLTFSLNHDFFSNFVFTVWIVKSAISRAPSKLTFPLEAAASQRGLITTGVFMSSLRRPIVIAVHQDTGLSLYWPYTVFRARIVGRATLAGLSTTWLVSMMAACTDVRSFATLHTDVRSCSTMCTDLLSSATLCLSETTRCMGLIPIEAAGVSCATIGSVTKLSSSSGPGAAKPSPANRSALVCEDPMPFENSDSSLTKPMFFPVSWQATLLRLSRCTSASKAS
mmetsp:Transcript_24988/g.47355  ORF Transcript_24988/g.47355 Transcript_24988/m.47355 type:complete len:284 (+) Transcript_24988:27-878(+)